MVVNPREDVMQQNTVLDVEYSVGQDVVVFARGFSPTCAPGTVESVSKFNLNVRFDTDPRNDELDGSVAISVSPEQVIPEDASVEELGARLEHHDGV